MRRLLFVTMLCLTAGTAWAQRRVAITDVGAGPSGRILQAALAQPHRLIEPDSGWFILDRNAQQRGTLIVLGRTAAIGGNVEGDVIVVGGDLFIRPGARVAGRAIAIGGGVYPSALAIVERGTHAYRDNTFSIAPDSAGYQLAYVSLRADASPPLLFPGIYGLRLPTYDRVNGLSTPFGPAFTFAGGRATVDILAIYRSDLGKIDPSLDGGLQLSRRLRAEFRAGRGTFSNDAWIWSDLVNSFATLTTGTDTRNYYRADRAEVTVHRLWEFTRTLVEPFVGGVAEQAWSVGPAVGELRGPWSVLWRKDTVEGIFRPNPAIDDGQITSILSGVRVGWEAEDLRARARTRFEMGPGGAGNRSFTQITSDVDVGFPTFGLHEYAMDVHWVTTPIGIVPRQRFVYLGGSGTLPFLDLLEQGGDEALLIDQRYSIPVPSVRVGILGEPTLIFRHRLGSAGLGELPSFEQMIGVGVVLTLLRVELQIDPARRKMRFSTGFSFSR